MQISKTMRKRGRGQKGGIEAIIHWPNGGSRRNRGCRQRGGMFEWSVGGTRRNRGRRQRGG